MGQEAPGGWTLRVGFVGAGRRGTALLHLLASAPTIQVVAVADPNPNASGLQLAGAQGIPVISSHREIFAYSPQIVIEATGRPEVREELERTKPPDVELVGAQSARLFWELVALRTAEAQQLVKAETIRRMTAGIFHSLNNLFTTLHGRSRLLHHSVEGNRATPAQLAEGLQVIARTVARGSEILQRLRGLTRELAEQPVTRVDVNALVRELVSLTDPLIREAQGRSAAIEVRQELGEIPPVVGRPGELLEALVNLIVNAVEAMPKGGVLTLKTAHEAAAVVVQVKDTGTGIPAAIKAQLFAPFFTTKAQGTGLGLSVSREIIGRHGGDLALESQEGEGTCFSVRLPAAEAGLPQKAMPVSDFRGWRVLVVDDDPFFREVLVELLAAEGCRVRSAARGTDALDWLKRERYDLVLCDVVMPDVAGWQVARVARDQDPAPVVILITGWPIPPGDPAIQASGADALLHKPIRIPELVEVVQGALETRNRPSG